MADLADRQRKVSIENMSPDEADRIGLEVGKKLGSIVAKLENKMNELMKAELESAKLELDALLKIYGQEGRIVPFTFQFKTDDDYGPARKL